MKVAAPILVALLGIAFVWQFFVAKHLREENSALRAQLAPASALAHENTRLSNALANASANLVDAKRQTQELLRLRNEVTSLRKQVEALEKLRAENEQLRTTSKVTAPVPAHTSTNDFLPQAAWQFVGFATPEAAFQSMSWAGANADLKTYLDCFTPEARAEFEKQIAGKTEAQIASRISAEMKRMKGFRVLENQPASDDETITTIAVDGLPKPLKLAFKRIGNEWKYQYPVRN